MTPERELLRKIRAEHIQDGWPTAKEIDALLALPAIAPHGTMAALQYLFDSTAPDGQWADQAVHNFVGAMLKLAPLSETAEIPEGCTPTDAKVLREGNAALAEENHNLRRCLRWYANGEHYNGLLNWEGPSGDDNWLCPPTGDFGDYRQEFIDKLDEAMVEDGSVARATLVSGKFSVESPEDEPKVVKGEPEWNIEQMAAAPSPDGNSREGG
jgi:hypothetical protein